MNIPELERHCGSWIITKGNIVRETFERRTAEQAASAGWTVETAAQYLGRINRQIREQAP